ncbi:ATP-dependent helicase/nuclease subunit A [Mycobacterium bohemicum DSM 44277]|nr:ATP-dependent helicase/nuclease subunit A [Mycobacterium bohemicum DSM 44277]
MDDLCERCYWVKLHLNHHLPFQMFPSIFSSIDSYTKDIVHSWFEAHGVPPGWLSPLGTIVAYQTPRHWSQFQTVDAKYGIRLTGVADAIFEYADGSLLIADYKTARFTDAENKKLMPRYTLQLNAYARIAAECGPAPISRLALIYMEPATKGDTVNYCGNCREDGFVMGFQARVVEIPVDDDLLNDALAKTREIFDLSDAPNGAPGCKDCVLVLDLAEKLWPGINDVDLADKLQRMLADPELRKPRHRHKVSANAAKNAGLDV